MRFIAFDLLYRDFELIMAEPLHVRRELLERLVLREAMLGSEAIRSEGRRLCRMACAAGLEGIVGKRLVAPIAPGGARMPGSR